jgi:hypothetical protein
MIFPTYGEVSNTFINNVSRAVRHSPTEKEKFS